MKELAVCERYIYGRLKPLATAYGWPLPQIAPFDLQDGADPVAAIPTPVYYFRHVATGDRNAVGPGERLMSWADYEIGVFHTGNSFGAQLKVAGLIDPLKSVLEIMTELDDIFQNYTPPIVDASLGGTVYSVQRQFAVRIPERFGGRLYRRDGGVYRFHVEAD